MDVGPVLDLEDVAGSKVCALAGVDDHVIPWACVHVIPQVLAYACFT